MTNRNIDVDEIGVNIQTVLVASYFRLNSNGNTSQDKAIEWASDEFAEAFKVVFSDPIGDRQTVYLKRVNDSGQADDNKSHLFTNRLSTSRFFTENQKSLIAKRDGYKCIVCGKGLKENADKLHIDHVRPRSRGGKTTLENGQTLCSPHFMFKKLYIHFYARAKILGDQIMECFFEDLLADYDKDNLISQSNWEKPKAKFNQFSQRNCPQYSTA